MFIVKIHDWDSDEVDYVGVFASVEDAKTWIRSQKKDDNEDVDYEICNLQTPQ